MFPISSSTKINIKTMKKNFFNISLKTLLNKVQIINGTNINLKAHSLTVQL
jgi:hypothetical protein